MKLQQFGQGQSTYERPNQKWVCGWHADGWECPLGPDGKGHCRATTECAPRRRGDRWSCARTPARGGPCVEGPLADGTCCKSIPRCQPRASLRAKRGAAVLWVTALVLGAVLLGLGMAGEAFVTPGELTYKHGTVVEGCAGCHTTASSGSGAWILTGSETESTPRCLTCHDLGSEPLAPHGVAADALAQPEASTRLALESVVAASVAWMPGGVPGDGEELACATCHTEHRGRNNDMTAMADVRCQTCHAVKFGSFGAGHPDFSSYPYERRTRIRFDHIAHQNTPGAAVCLDCHVPSAGGRTMDVRNFSTACAGCHLEDVRGGFPPEGAPVFTVPTLDLQSLADAGLSVGTWPDYAFDGGLTPYMRMLVADEYAAELELTRDLFFDDLAAATPEQLQATVDLAWALKEIFGLGTREILNRLDSPEETTLVAGLSDDLLAAAIESWLPGARGEADSHYRGETPPMRSNEPGAGGGAVPLAGWYRDDDTLSLRYLAAEHGDPLLRAWIERAAGQAAGSEAGLANLADFIDVDQNCTLCHTIDALPDGGARVNWQPRREIPNEHRFTAFSHTAHFSLVSERQCRTCHVFTDAASEATAAVAVSLDPSVFVSNFAPLDRQTCASCHFPRGAGDACLLCHNYHVGEFSPTNLLLAAPIPPADESPPATTGAPEGGRG